jgi:hypothetical protein
MPGREVRKVERAVPCGVDVLVLDLIEWLSRRERSYEETMDAWRTSCPRLPVWEEANERGLVATEYRGGCSWVRVTLAGMEVLARCRPGQGL